MDPVALPFSYTYTRQPNYASLRVQGVLRMEAGGLVIELREQPQMSSSRKKVDTSIRTLSIPWSDLQSIEVRTPWLLRPRIVLRTRSLRALEGVPKARGSEATLPVARADRGLASELAAYVDAALAEDRLRALDAPEPPRTLGASEQPRALPHARGSE